MSEDVRKKNLILWEKGKPSPNPKGKPKGTKNRSTLLRYWLDAKENGTHPVTGEPVTLTQEDQMIIALIGAAKKGDVRAAHEILDSVYGKVKEQVEHSNPDGSALAQPIADAMTSFEKSLLKIYGDEPDDQ